MNWLDALKEVLCDKCEECEPCPECPECPEPAPPPPEPEPQPDGDPTELQYITTDRAVLELNVNDWTSLAQLMQQHIWQAIRDPEKVISLCPSAWGTFFDEDIDEAYEFVAEAKSHYKEARHVQLMLSTLHPSYPGRVRARKSAVREAKEALRRDLKRAGIWRDAVRGKCNKKPYDSIAGWCTCERS